MAGRRNEPQLAPLNIPLSFNNNLPQFNGGMYSPALPTPMQQGFMNQQQHQQAFHPSHRNSPSLMMHANGYPIHTPMQQYFHNPPQAPGRPTHHQHASLGGAALMNPPMSAITPLHGHFPRPSVMLGPGGVPMPMPFQPNMSAPYPGRQRRQQSIGGPPKAVLGGPQRRASAAPGTLASATATASGAVTPTDDVVADAPTTPAVAQLPKPKIKKFTVKFPKESVVELIPNDSGDATEGGITSEAVSQTQHPEWARTHLTDGFEFVESEIQPPETTSSDVYPSDKWRFTIPDTLDVFLPGKAAWEELKQEAIELKLRRLGVERGLPPHQPPIHAPHARAASISSPADPALLLWKLNKLQQYQSQSHTPSVSGDDASAASPQPSLPNQGPPSFAGFTFGGAPNRGGHGHSMSLAHPPTFINNPYANADDFNVNPNVHVNDFSFGSVDVGNNTNPALATVSPNPFGPFATLGSDQVILPKNRASSPGRLAFNAGGIHAPQGRVPVPMSSLNNPAGSSTSPQPPVARPDFTVGFGLDIPEESEEEVAESERESMAQDTDQEGDSMVANFVTDEAGRDREYEAERYRDQQDQFNKYQAEERRWDEQHNELNQQQDDFEETEGQRTARHSRHVSRVSAALSLMTVGGLVKEEVQEEATNQPRGRGIGILAHGDDEVDDAVEEWTGSEAEVDLNTSDDESIGEWSNPSDEERARQQRADRRARRRAEHEPRRIPNFPRPPAHYDDIISNPSEEEERDMEYRPHSGLSLGSTRPLPPLPHSRVPSGQFSTHDPARAHSRSDSGHLFVQHSSRKPSLSNGRETLNPFAKPFVFGASSSLPQVNYQNQPSSMQPSYSMPMPSYSMPMPSHTMPPPSIPWKSSDVFGDAQTQSQPPFAFGGHARTSSFGKPLNAAAPAFNPGKFGFSSSSTGASDGVPSIPFNFRPPPGVPQMPVPQFAPRPLPSPPSRSRSTSTESDNEEMELVGGREQQGREKRRRRLASTSSDGAVVADETRYAAFIGDHESEPATRDRDYDDEDKENSRENAEAVGNDSMLSFRFPPDAQSSPMQQRRHSDYPKPSVPFSFGGFSKAEDEPEEAEADEHPAEEDDLEDESTAKDQPFSTSTSNTGVRTPLDFQSTNPSGNTVPAGLFKALVNSVMHDERTRRTVRSRLDSREIFDNHGRRPSSSTSNMNLRSNGNRFVTDPGRGRRSRDQDEQEDNDGYPAHNEENDKDVFGPKHERRRSSLPPARAHRQRSATPSSVSSPIPAMDLTGKFELHQYERRLEALLDERMSSLRADILRQQAVNNDVVSLFRSQLAHETERAKDVVDNSQLDARGEIDFQMIRDVVMEGQAVWQHEIGEVVRRLENIASKGGNSGSNVQELMAALQPALATLRIDPVDYEVLTAQLTQAVKPHIAQLIDLASDKRETAGLIVNAILPLLPKQSSQQVLDMDAITTALTTEVRRAIAPIDAFEIKEQVADLVVERLDSRLAVRDRAFNLDSVKKLLDQKDEKLVDVLAKAAEENREMISQIKSAPVQDHEQLTILNELQSRLEQLMLKEDHKHVLERLATLPDAVNAATNLLQGTHAEFALAREATQREVETLRLAHTDLQVQVAKARGAHGQVRVEKEHVSDRLAMAESERDALKEKVKSLSLRVEAGEDGNQKMAGMEARNKELEEALAAALTRLQTSDVSAQANTTRINELERANRELGAEVVSLGAKVESKDLQATFAVREKDTANKALATLQCHYDTLSTQYERLTVQQSDHFADLRTATEKIDVLTTLIGQADSDEVKELRRVREVHSGLESAHANLLSQYSSLESELALFKKRVKEQEREMGNVEAKVTNSDRAAGAARASLVQAQARAAEWEKRAVDWEMRLKEEQSKVQHVRSQLKELEGDLELKNTKLEQAEQTQAQLDADYSIARERLEEVEADGRLRKNRESNLQDEVKTHQTTIAQLQAELAQVKEKAKIAARARDAVPFYPNSVSGPARPASRAHSSSSSISIISRSATPNGNANSRGSAMNGHSPLPQKGEISVTPPDNRPSVRDSIHAPSQNSIHAPAPTSQRSMHALHTSSQRASSQYVSPTAIHAPPSRYPNGPMTPKARRQIAGSLAQYRASPTHSVVSLAPTQGEDGWWS